MAEYRNRTTGEVKTQGQWRQEFSNMSLPRTWNESTLDALDLDPVLPGAKAVVGVYQESVRDGVVQDADGNWVENYVARDMFQDTTEDGLPTTKADHEAAYQAGLDAKAAKSNRAERNKLLAESDWTQMADSPLTDEEKSAWSTYRQALRDITSHANFPHLSSGDQFDGTSGDWPTKPE